MRTALVALIISVIALAWFNPGMDAFRLFVEEHSERILLNEAGDSAVGRALAGAGGALAGAYVDRVTERRNYAVFSIYTRDLDGDDEQDEEWRFLGIAGHFFELQQPESLRE
jgi:hypothetical protein